MLDWFKKIFQKKTFEVTISVKDELEMTRWYESYNEGIKDLKDFLEYFTKVLGVQILRSTKFDKVEGKVVNEVYQVAEESEHTNNALHELKLIGEYKE